MKKLLSILAITTTISTTSLETVSCFTKAKKSIDSLAKNTVYNAIVYGVNKYINEILYKIKDGAELIVEKIILKNSTINNYNVQNKNENDYIINFDVTFAKEIFSDNKSHTIIGSFDYDKKTEEVSNFITTKVE